MAYVAVILIDFLPAIAIENLIMAEEALENDSVRDNRVELGLLHHLAVLESWAVIVELLGIVITHAIDILILQLILDIMMRECMVAK